MRKLILGGVALLAATTSAFAFNDPRVAGTWIGQSSGGTDVLVLGSPHGDSGGTASLQRYVSNQLVYRLDGSYRFNENPMLPNDRYQIQVDGTDNVGSHHTVSYSIQSLDGNQMTLRGVMTGYVEQMQRQ
jgi:hypothetical protein